MFSPGSAPERRATVFLSVWLKQGFQREILFKTRSAGELRASPLQCVRQKDTRVRKRAYASRALKSINPGASRRFSLALLHGCNRKGLDDLPEHGRAALHLPEVPAAPVFAQDTARRPKNHHHRSCKTSLCPLRDTPRSNADHGTLWRGGRVVECTALEMRHTGNRIEGSNPSLSAIKAFNFS